ncbi:hypothetical protein GFPCMMHI_02490 [Ensifer adhaerens]|nr:hypothetical protein [Ensifer adhaerens]
MVRLGEAEAADPFASGKLWQIFLLLGLRPESVDRHHDQRGLHAHHRAIAAVDALDLAGDQAVGDITEAGAAIFRRNRRSEQAEFAHLAEDRRIGLFMAEGFEHAGGKLLLRIGMRGIQHHAFFIAQLLHQPERIGPVENLAAHAVVSH